VDGSRETWPAAIAAPVCSWLISFTAHDLPEVDRNARFGAGSQTKPKCIGLGLSGSKSGFGDVMMARCCAARYGNAQIAADRVSGGREGGKPATPFSAGLGARKPSEYVPRRAQFLHRRPLGTNLRRHRGADAARVAVRRESQPTARGISVPARSTRQKGRQHVATTVISRVA